MQEPLILSPEQRLFYINYTFLFDCDGLSHCGGISSEQRQIGRHTQQISAFYLQCDGNKEDFTTNFNIKYRTKTSVMKQEHEQ